MLETDTADPVPIRERRLERVRNAAQATNVFAGFWLFFLFAIPLLIILAYHFFGWKPAVLVFPLLLVASWFSRRRKPSQRRARSNRKHLNVLLWAVAFGIPVISITMSNPEFMRLWALAAAMWLTESTADRKREAQKQWASKDVLSSERPLNKHFWFAAPGLLFVAGSEAIWHFWNLGAWIWYHAFFLQVFVGIWVLVQWLQRVRGDGAALQGDTVIQSKPPNARSKKQGERHTVFVKRTDGIWHQYKNITLGQACRLFEECSSGDLPVTLEDDEPGGEEWRAFNVNFEGSTEIRIARLDPEERTLLLVDWQYTTPISGHWLKFPMRMSTYRSVPSEFIPELLELGWQEDWDGVAARLEPFVAAK